MTPAGQEFVELMIKREAEKETQEDLKQVFRVFDKVTTFKQGKRYILSGWEWLCVHFRNQVCVVKVSSWRQLKTHIMDSQDWCELQ